MPKVSIIVPFYNREKSLGWCISSILNQSFKNFELLLIDDGSTDASEQIAKNYAKLDSRIQLVHTPHSGVSAARNMGIFKSSGEYIQFMDSDDWIPYYFLDRLLSTMELYEADIVLCGINIVQKQGQSITKSGKLSYEALGEECVWEHEQLWDNMARVFWQTGMMEGPCNRIYRASLIKKHSVKFPEDMSYGEDCVFNLFCYNYAKRVVFLSDLLYYYVQHEEQSWTKIPKKCFFRNQVRQVELMREMMQQNHSFTQENKRFWANYCAAQVTRVLETLKEGVWKGTKLERKQEILSIVQNKNVQIALTQIDWISGTLSSSVGEKIKNCDVGGIARLCEQDEVCHYRQSVVCPGKINCCLVELMHGLQRIPIKWIKKWAKVLELNLSTVGIKVTLHRMRHKLFHKAIDMKKNK